MSLAITKGISDELLSKLVQSQTNNNGSSFSISDGKAGTETKSFMDHLKDGVNEVNTEQKVADKKTVDISTGRSGDIHEAMLAATQAELSFNLMVQVRNKCLEAYQDVMRMPV